MVVCGMERRLQKREHNNSNRKRKLYLKVLFIPLPGDEYHPRLFILYILFIIIRTLIMTTAQMQITDYSTMHFPVNH